MTTILRVTCAQTGAVSPSTPLLKTIEKACGMIKAAAEARADLILFPELFLHPFFPNDLKSDFDDFFLDPSGPEIGRLKDCCSKEGVAAILPVGERSGILRYNSALYVDMRGRLRGSYRKTHIPAYFPTDQPGGTGSYEKLFFTPGNVLPTFEAKGERFGIQTCNDRLFPEASRVLALAGARILFMPISYSTYDQPERRRANWDAILRARAIENGVYVVACNRVGREGPRCHLGTSMIVSPTGEVLATGSDKHEEIITVDLDSGPLNDARLGMPWWRDRRPELYKELSVTDPI